MRRGLLVIPLVCLAACSSALGPSADTEEGYFHSGATRLSYALDIPAVGTAPYPLVVIGHDSGPNSKNENKEWARHLTEDGIAVLRFDKRGVGDSEGEYRRGFADFEVLSGDLVAAVEFVVADPRVDPSRVGLIGSSQAGWIIPMVATRSPFVSFAMMLSGPTVTVAEHNYWADIASDESLSIDQLTDMLATFQPGAGDFDPRPFLDDLAVPSIWVFGLQDRIIPAPRSAEIVEEIVTQLGSPFTVLMYPNGNHGLRDDDNGGDLPYWDDLLPWLRSVLD